MFRSLCVVALLVPSLQLATAAEVASVSLERQLSEFGPITKPSEAQETYNKAVQQLNQSGGILVVPAATWKLLKPAPLQSLVRVPEAPAPAKTWRQGPGVTVVTADEQHVRLQVPPMSGLVIDREVRLADHDSLPHWGTHPAVTIDSKIVYGSSSFLDWIQAPVEKGPDRRFYVLSARGIHPGQFLNVHGGPGYGGGVTRAYVKSLGYDVVKRLAYFVADTEIDHKVGAIAHNKSNTGLIHMLQTSHNDNQTYDVKVIRNQYAHGDTYMFYGDFNYMSNVHSAAGDENGNVFAAFIRSKDDNFRATVDNVDWSSSQLKFKAGRNVDSLGDSRPLVNRNPAKAITAGKVMIVPPICYWMPNMPGSCEFEGKAYPTTLIKNPVTGVSELKMGGLIRGDKNCPWTEEIVGRYFAISDKGEKTPKGNLRWYLITNFREDGGKKEIEIRRYWWGAKSAGSPTLYSNENYSWDGHERPLEYIIAPGTYVNDVSRAIPGGDRGGQSLLGVTAYREQGTPLDFAPGDEVEQAIGPDPFKPQAMRVWMWEDVPGAFPAAVFDLANNGASSRYSAMTIAGGPQNMDDVAKRHQPKPAWDNVIVLNAATGVGINCKADFAEAAILFQQPHHEQPIKWHYGHTEDALPKTASLTVTKETGELNYQGNGVRTNGSVTAVAGISGDNTPAKNLRGKNVEVKVGAMSYQVRFAQPEADGDYAVFIEQSWLSNRAISEKTADGFTITFATAAPEKARLDWMIVR